MPDDALYCDHCHTRWIEACFHPWMKCPFVDCDGALRRGPPRTRAVFLRAPKAPSTHPLFDQLEDDRP